MRYGLVLLAGLAGGFIFASIWPRSANPPSETISAEPVENAAEVKQVVSPFSPVSEQPTQEAAPTVSPRESDNEEQTVVQLSFTELSDLQHYSQLSNFFTQLKTADNRQLKALAEQVKTQFPHSYNNQYYNAISTAVYQRWADVDFDAALDSLSDLQSAMHGPDLGVHMNMIQVLAREQPERIQSWMQTQNPAVREMVQYTVYAGMANRDPQTMARQALELNTPESEEMLHMALSQWAIEDPAAAWQFIQGNDGSDKLQSAHETVLRTWVDNDATSALPVLEQLINENSSNRYIQNNYSQIYLSALAQTDPQSALDYISSQTDYEQLHALDPGTFYQLANHHPALLENWLQQIPEEKMMQLGPIALMPLIETQAMNNPRAAMEMIDNFPQAREMGIQSMVLDQWLMTDSTGAVEWLKTQPGSDENRDTLAQAALTLLHSNIDPAEGLSLIEQIDLPVNADTATQIAYSVGSENPALARDWLSRNTDPATYAIASLTIDAIDQSIPTSQILQQLESTGLTLQPYTVMNILSIRMQDRDSILQWLETTSVTSEADRTQLQMMLGYEQGGGAAYYQRDMEMYPLPFDR